MFLYSDENFVFICAMSSLFYWHNIAIIVPNIIGNSLIELIVELKKQNVLLKFNFLVKILYLCMLFIMKIKPRRYYIVLMIK